MANIKKHLDNIKGALFGKDVRSSIHDGIDAINKEVESTTNRQEHLEDTFDQLVINSGNSNAEIVDARVGENGKSYAKLGDRLDEVDSQLEQNTKHFYSINKFAKSDYITDKEVQDAIDYISIDGGTLVLDSRFIYCSKPIILKPRVNLLGTNNDEDYDFAGESNSLRGTCFIANEDFNGEALIIQDSDKNKNRSQFNTIEKIRFRGLEKKPFMIGLLTKNHLLKIKTCYFQFLNIGIQSLGLIDISDCHFEMCNTMIELNGTESYITNVHGTALKYGIVLNGAGHRVTDCKLFGDSLAKDSGLYDKGSLFGIYIRGNRNIVCNNYIDQWKHAGIYVDSSLKEATSIGNEPALGSYGNVISNNLLFNNGHAEFTNNGSKDSDAKSTMGISAGICLRVDPNTTWAGEVKRNVISNNIFETEFFKGWEHEGTLLYGQRVGIHIIGNIEGDIYDNVISGNSFDREIFRGIILSNATMQDNTIIGNTCQMDVRFGTLPTPNAKFRNKIAQQDLESSGYSKLFMCADNKSGAYSWYEIPKTKRVEQTFSDTITIEPNSSIKIDIALIGVEVGDFVLANIDTDLKGCLITSNVRNNDAVSVNIFNPTNTDVTFSNYKIRCCSITQ